MWYQNALAILFLLVSPSFVPAMASPQGGGITKDFVNP